MKVNGTTEVPTLTLRRQIAAPPSELFDAWLDPDKLAEWMRPGGEPPSKVDIDPRVGGELEVDMHTSAGKVPHTGSYRVIDRPNRLAFTWNSVAAGNRESLVTVDFKPLGGAMTEVVLTHENLPSLEMVEGHSKGWTRILELMSESYPQAA
jgi:uncharacterized protein YndB with AHSA1/START domain